MTTESGYAKKEFLEYILNRLVDEPNEVRVNMLEGQETLVFEVKVSKGDMGKVIGRKGQNINAIRTLLAAIGGKDRRHANIELLEDKADQ